MKSYYSCIDATISAPQPEQHQLISAMAAQQDGKIVFYGAEDYFMTADQPFILPKLKRTPGLDGVIFFTVNQFCYGEDMNFRLLLDILDLGMCIHFARENISINNKEDLDASYIMLRSYAHTLKKGYILDEVN